MPCSYVIDAERNLVISTGSGTITAAEVLNHRQRLSADPAFSPDLNQLVDFTELTDIDISAEWVRHLAERHLFTRGSRRAFLVSSALAVGMSNMYASFREFAGGEEEMKIFRDRDEALNWLLGDKADSLSKRAGTTA